MRNAAAVGAEASAIAGEVRERGFWLHTKDRDARCWTIWAACLDDKPL